MSFGEYLDYQRMIEDGRRPLETRRMVRHMLNHAEVWPEWRPLDAVLKVRAIDMGQRTARGHYERKKKIV